MCEGAEPAGLRTVEGVTVVPSRRAPRRTVAADVCMIALGTRVGIDRTAAGYNLTLTLVDTSLGDFTGCMP